jgi:hypothetical protein
MVGRVVALLHPAVDVVTGVDLELMDVWRVAESLQLLRDPVGPVAVAGCVGDEEMSATRPNSSALHERLRAGASPVFIPRRRARALDCACLLVATAYGSSAYGSSRMLTGYWDCP